jgi:hypothetical protein
MGLKTPATEMIFVKEPEPLLEPCSWAEAEAESGDGPAPPVVTH